MYTQFATICLLQSFLSVYTSIKYETGFSDCTNVYLFYNFFVKMRL